MSALFGFARKKVSPQKLIENLRDELRKEDRDKAEVDKRISDIKKVLYGELDSKQERIDPDESRCYDLSNHFVEKDIMVLIVTELPNISFEGRKHLSQILCNLITRDFDGRFSSHIVSNPSLLDMLVEGYEEKNQEIALNCGEVLRECIRHEKINRLLLASDTTPWRFIEHFVHLPAFDLASDAFATFKDMLTTHHELAAKFLDERYDDVFERYNKCLLQSENYVTKRQSLKLLGELLLHRANFTVMMRYISQRSNLKLMMLLLRDKSANIQFEAFHVFKVFVANPKKPEDIKQILLTNKDKLIAYLEKFHAKRDGSGDEQFEEEKALLIKTIDKLE
jgi:calcium binding protein 39